MMKRPRPPYDRTAPMVAVAMTWSVAVRKPPTMTAIDERQLDPAEDLAPGHAHAAAGLDQVAIHGPQARVRGDEDGRDASSSMARKIGMRRSPTSGA